MKLIETDGKRLLSEAGIAVPPGVFIESKSHSWPENVTWGGRCMVKAQVLMVGRGQAGLVLPCETQAEFPSVLRQIREALQDEPCAGFLCEPIIPHSEEWLVSCDIDRTAGAYRLSFDAEGGMAVRSATTLVFSSLSDLDEKTIPEALRSTFRILIRSLIEWDALRIEINPLVRTDEGTLMALDAKIELDDQAEFRHPDWSGFTQLSPYHRPFTPREQLYTDLLNRRGHRGTLGNYVELEGDVALVLSGGGASLVALDALARSGGRPANYVEMSGNPDPEAVLAACRIVFSKPGIRGIWIAGSHANFTDIAATLQATLTAITDSGLRVPVVIRRDGPRAEEASAHAESWATSHGQRAVFHRSDVDMETSAAALVALMRS